MFCQAGDMGYDAARTAFEPGQPFTLDDSYRLAHLPLVAPGHPDVIARCPGTDYEMGRHARVFSLVLPIDADALEASPAWRAFEADLRSQPFADKVAWALPPRRRGLLHATVCGSLGRGEPPLVDADALAGISPFEIELRGIFSGNVNLGRLYLPAFPEKVSGENVIHRIQRAMDRPVTSMHLVGMHNLVDHLTRAETHAFAALLSRWHDTPFIRLTITELWLLGSHDDLVLDAAIEARLRLGRRSR